jgi:phytoene/squalene synthetase
MSDEGLNADALTVWLADHPSAVNDAPDLVALARTLATAVDGPEDDKVLASLALQYRQTLLALREVGAQDGDGQAELARDLSSTVPD